MKGTRIFARGAQMEALIEEIGGDPAVHPVKSVYVTGEQMERLIDAAGGDAPTNPVRSKYATGEQMERLIAAYGGDAPTNPVHSKYATAEQMERLIAAVGGDPAEYPVPSKYITAEQMARLVEALEGGTDPLSVISGEIASWTSSRSKPFEGLVVDIDPVQDLHGYANPWPAGGGKNLFNMDGEYIADSYINSSGEVVPCVPPVMSNVYTEYIPVTAGAAYTFSGTSSEAAYIRIGQYNENKLFIGRALTTQAVNPSVTVTMSSSAAYVRISPDVTVSNVQMEKGGTKTDYAPYENICPISGWTGANVTRTGKNYLDFERAVDGATIKIDNNRGTAAYNSETGEFVVTSSYSGSGNIIVNINFLEGESVTLPKTTAEYLTLSYKCSGVIPNSNNQVRTVLYFTDGSYTFGNVQLVDNRFMLSNSAANHAGKTLQKLLLYAAYGGAAVQAGDVIKYWDLQLEYTEVQNTATDYVPCASDTLSIDWTDEAGTVYGGTLDVTTGVLTATYAVKDMGDLSWEVRTDYFRTGGLSPKAKRGANGVVTTALCEFYPPYAPNDFYYHDYGFSISNDSTPRLVVKDKDYSDAPSLKTAVTGKKVIYELAEPVEYTLDPETIDTLVGLNNVWADTGDVEVTVYGTPIVEPDADALTSLNILLGGRYTRSGDDPSDEEALDIIMGGTR